jgi:hypothetical protein
MAADKRELKATCILGAMYLPDGGYVGGSYARTRVQKDPANLSPSTFNHNSNRPADVSPRLQPVTQNSGGISPVPNRSVGASLCTFVFGGIAPDDGKSGNEKHPQLNLIKGPKPTVSYDDSSLAIFKYDPTFIDEVDFSGTAGDGTDFPDFDSSLPSSPSTQYPLVPAVSSSRYASAPVLPTYNIWKVHNVDEKSITYTKYKGPNFAKGYQGPRIRQVFGADGTCYIEASAQNIVADLRRIFPISRDLMYDASARLYYPTDSGSTFSRPILARGGKNCGFQLHFAHSSVATMTNPKSSDSTGSVRIIWGNITALKKGDFITNYQLTLVPGKAPELTYYHPGKGEWVPFQLQGPTFGSGSYSVYVHYAGPSLMIGFDSDMSQWNTFTPIDDKPSGDYTRSFEHMIDDTASIRMLLTNITTAFQYGGIAFNNYNPEQRVPDANGAIDADADLGFHKVSNSAPVSKANTISATAIQSYLDKHRYLGKNSQDFDNDFESNATYYGDWRSPSPELVYKELSRSESNNEIQVSGAIVYKTTIEGPHFLHVRNSDEGTATASQGELGGESAQGSGNSAALSSNSSSGNTTSDSTIKPKVIEDLPWGDISEWLTNFDVTYSLTGNNKTVLEGRAEITLVNMALSDHGDQILDALENNVLTVTLAAGYGDTPTYFQGVVETQKTVRFGDRMITTLSAVDIMSKCLSDIPFKSVLYFGGMRYGRILDYCMACSGFGDYYRRQTSSLDDRFSIFSDNMNYRLSNSPVSESLANDVLNANYKKVILDVLRPTLELVSSREALPVLRWDPQDQLVRVDWRYEPDYQDSLKFLGAPNAQNITFYPNTTVDPTSEDESDETGDDAEQNDSPEDLVDPMATHGVLTSQYSIETNNNQLVAGITMYGQALDSRMIVEDRVFQDAFSEAALQRLKSSVGQGKSIDATQIGYVGYRKHIVDQTKTNTIPDKLSLKRYVDDLENDFLRKTYQNINFECYVTKPLQHHAHFVIQTFLGSAPADVTDAYLYRQVSYSFTKGNNTITASVSGERFPTMIRALERSAPMTDEELF